MDNQQDTSENTQSTLGEDVSQTPARDEAVNYYDQYIRMAADFENFRKRYAQEREALLKYGSEHAMHELIPVLDNLERAMGSLSETSDAKILFQSLRLMSSQLQDCLSNIGLKKLNAVGEAFDVSLHEAVSQQETSEHPEGTIITEVQSGYLLKDRLIRPSRVIVAATPSKPDKTNPFMPDVTATS
ncbi:MAG: nucleotide exchange factor GrpE [Cyanobacteria bacterium]|nr:nucleotide exchange factor GrpE [Cyanobacteriota bacterium]